MEDRVNIDVLVYNNVEELDFIGPIEIFGKVNDVSNDRKVSIRLMSLKKMIKCKHGTKIISDPLNSECYGDVLVIPGGPGAREDKKDIKELIDFISLNHNNYRYVLSICTGAFLLAKAGLLRYKNCVTHTLYQKELKRIEGSINLIDKRVVMDGNIITSKGVCAGIDAALFLVKIIFKDKIAKEIIKRIEYNLSLSEVLANGFISGRGDIYEV